jgi:aerobic-type carbon monoxide dehydrogenase small subunit (CoxS/CutS family)
MSTGGTKIMEIPVTINGEKKVINAKPNEILLDVLRREGYFGVKRGCSEGNCGSCTVMFNGIPRKTCIMFVGQIKDKKIFTVEGLGTRENPHPVQKTYATNGAAQCGFCIPGQIVSAVALLEKNSNPSEEEIKAALDGNICRCTGYVKQIEAIHQAAKIIQEGKR